MRAKEFIDEIIYYNDFPLVDVTKNQMEEMRQIIRLQPHLFENSVDFKSLVDFLKLHDTTVPEIDKLYVPISILSIPLANVISIKQLTEERKLIEISNNKFFFKTPDGIKWFPGGQTISNDQLQHSLFFHTIKERDEFLLLLKMKFGHWSISTGNLL